MAENAPPVDFIFASTPLPDGQEVEFTVTGSGQQSTRGHNCFARGTLIDTPHGAIAVEHLDSGDEIMTRQGGVQLITWIGQRRLSGLELVLMPHLQPVRIMAGALSGGRPGQDLIVARDHRLLVDDWRAPYLFGVEEILIPAKSLLNSRTVFIDCPTAGIEYFHVLTQGEALICANGLWAETMSSSSENLDFLSPDQRAQVAQVQQSDRVDPSSMPLPALSYKSAPSIAA